jgi:hypothetical protein
VHLKKKARILISLFLSRLFVCLRGTAPLPPDEFSLHLIFSSFTKFCLPIGILFELGQKNRGFAQRHSNINVNMLPLFDFLAETCRVPCEVLAETVEIVDNLYIKFRHDRLQISSFKESRRL